MNCKRTIRIIEQRSFGSVGYTETISVRFHLSYCKHCRNYEKTSLLLDKLISRSLRETPPLSFSKDEKNILLERLLNNDQ